MNEQTQLVIKNNGQRRSGPCAICGKPADGEVGPDLFVADTASLVCWDCGEQIDPDLVAMLRTHRAWAAAYFVAPR
jgi:hypothetical protein